MLDAPVYHNPDDVLDWIRFTPHAPFWALLGILCCLIVLPRFWPTRIFTLNFHASAILVSYIVMFIDTLVWRDHARYIPVYTETREEMLLHLIDFLLTFLLSCLAEFVQQCDEPRQFNLRCQIFMDLFDAVRDDSRVRSGASHALSWSVLKDGSAEEDQ